MLGMGVTYTLALIGITFRWTAAGLLHELHGDNRSDRIHRASTTNSSPRALLDVLQCQV